MLRLRPSFVEIDTDALEHNVRTVCQRVGPGIKVFVVMKGDAYGLGSVATARAARAGGAYGLSTANPDFVSLIREDGNDIPVLIYPASLPPQAAELLSLGIIPTIHDFESMDGFARLGKAIDVYVKVDCGNTRLGFPPQTAAAAFERLREYPQLRLAAVYSQFRSQRDPLFVQRQAATFDAICKIAEQAGFSGFDRMVSPSDLVLERPQLNYTAVNPGKIIYGLVPDAVIRANGLKPVVTGIRARIIQVRTVAAGEYDFGADEPLTVPRRIAVASIGFLDGLNHQKPCHEVLVRGRRAKVLGLRSMEYTIFDVTSIEGVEVGDEVALLGKQGDDEITAEELAGALEMPIIELIPKVGRMATRRYIGVHA